MYKTCKTARSSERQKFIGDVLIQMMKTHRLDHISISELCIQAQIPRKTFYRYFDTQEDVLAYLFERSTQEYRKFCLEQTPVGLPSGEKMLENFLIFWSSRTDFLEAICHNGMVAVLVDYLIRTSIHDSEFLDCLNPDADPQFIHDTITFWVSGITSFLIQNHQHTDLRSPEEITKIILRIFSCPLLATP